MALHKVFAILDLKANAFMPPFAAPATGIAVRSFADTVNDPNTILHRHPKDFRLAFIGTFDDNNALLTSSEPEWLGFASDYLEPPTDGAPVTFLPPYDPNRRPAP